MDCGTIPLPRRRVRVQWTGGHRPVLFPVPGEPRAIYCAASFPATTSPFRPVPAEESVMSYQHTTIPETGDKIRVANDCLAVTDQPILGYVEGDGIGPDITRACLRIWDAAVERAYGGRRKVHWAELYMGEKAAGLFDGDYFPQETRDALQDLIVSIKGPLTTPVGGGFRSLNVGLRQVLDLYACVRPVRYYAGVPSPVRRPQDVDVVIFRENTEDVYAGIEYEAGTAENEKFARFLREEMGAVFFEGAGLGVKPISPFGTNRLVRKAIQYAVDHDRKSVTFVHKGNIMKFTEGAFRNWAYELARTEFGEHTITEDELWEKHDGRQPEGQDRRQGPHRGHHVPDDAAPAGGVRRDRDLEPERRLPVRRGGGGGRGGRHRAGREHGRSRRGVRGDPRNRPEVREPGQGQSRARSSSAGS